MAEGLNLQRPSKTLNARTLGVAAAIIVVTAVVFRSVWISLYGVDIPFWDQWAQITTQLADLKQGTWHYHDYWAAHNEHRILFTRLISMVLFEIDDRVWSNLVEAYANTFIYGTTLALFYTLACRESNQASRLIMLFAILVMAIMPFGWENNLVGFQSQFYVMILFAISLAGVASYRRPSRSTFWILTALALASLFTMASGLLGAVAVCVAVMARSWRETLPKFYRSAVIFTMAIVVLCGLLLLPSLPGNEEFKAHGIVEHARAFSTALIWPLNTITPRNLALGLIFWCPSIIWSINLLRTRTAKKYEVFLISLAAWVICQDLAIAHARGHNFTSLPSRYADIAALGLLANFALALSLVFQEHLPIIKRYSGYISIALFVSIVAAAFIQRTAGDMDEMQQRYDFSRMQAFYTHSYLVTRYPGFLQHPSLTIPFPDASALKSFLDSPTVDSLLPPIPEAMSKGSELGEKRGAWAAHTALDVQKFVVHIFSKMGIHSSSIFYRHVPKDSDLGLKSSATGKCSASQVNRSEFKGALVYAKIGDPLLIDGWIIKPSDVTTRRFHVVLLGNQRYEIEGRPTIKRKDVEKVMHSRAVDTYGFRAYGILQDVAPGTYTARLSTAPGGSQTICELPYQVIVVR